MPDDENDDIIIYIETSKIGVPTIIETLTHEIVHAYDFKQFSKIINETIFLKLSIMKNLMYFAILANFMLIHMQRCIHLVL